MWAGRGVIAGDEKPQSRGRMLSTGGLVSIKNSCQKKKKKKRKEENSESGEKWAVR